MPVSAVLISHSRPLVRHQPKLQNHSVSCNVPVYLPTFAFTNVYCLVMEAHGCEQLAWSGYLIANSRELNSRPFDLESDALPLVHQAGCNAMHTLLPYYVTHYAVVFSESHSLQKFTKLNTCMSIAGCDIFYSRFLLSLVSSLCFPSWQPYATKWVFKN